MTNPSEANVRWINGFGVTVGYKRIRLILKKKLWNLICYFFVMKYVVDVDSLNDLKRLKLLRPVYWRSCIYASYVKWITCCITLPDD